MLPSFVSQLLAETPSTDSPPATLVDAAESPATTPPVKVSAKPTHRQKALIAANVEGQPETSITCFALVPDGRILAGCSSTTGELRLFDAEGKFVESKSVPVKPEAIFVSADGTIFLAGEGELLRLSSDGTVELQKPAPHAAALRANPDKLREEVVNQAKQRVQQFADQSSQFTRMIERVDMQITSLKEQLEKLEQANQEASDDVDAGASNANQTTRRGNPARSKQLLERRMASQQQMKEQYESAKKQWDEMVEQSGPQELDGSCQSTTW